MYYIGWLLILATTIYFLKDKKNAADKYVAIKYIAPTTLHVIGLCMALPEFMIIHATKAYVGNLLKSIEYTMYGLAIALPLGIWVSIIINNHIDRHTNSNGHKSTV